MTAHATTAIAETLGDAIVAHARTVVKRAALAATERDDAVRRTRVASRRLREVLAVVSDAGVRRDVSTSEREARRVTRALGRVREIDVAIQELARVGKRQAWSSDRMLAIGRRLDREGERARRPMMKAMRALDGEALATRCDRLAKAIGSRSDEAVWWDALVRRVSRRAKRVSEAIAASGTLYAPERLHALRVAIKKLRYALELVRGARGLEVDAAIRALRKMQTRFGHLHDIQILLAEVQALAIDSGRSNPRQTFATEIESLERDCRQIHARILPHLPALQAHVAAVRRDLSARSHGGRLSMAKAKAAGRRNIPGRKIERAGGAVR